MIQTTEVWVVVCDKCHKAYERSFASRYQLMTQAERLGGWVITDKSALCADCIVKEYNYHGL